MHTTRGWTLSLSRLAATWLLTACSAGCLATGTPLQLAVDSKLQLFPHETEVRGLRLILASGANRRVSGIDLRLSVAQAEKMLGLQISPLNVGKEGIGIQAGLGNVGQDSFSGLQFAAVANQVEDGRATGAQLSLLVNLSEHMRGLQAAAYNGSSDARGVQLGIANLGTVSGLQLGGLLNLTTSLCGVQIGLLNLGEGRGVQIGLLNFDSWSLYRFPVPGIRFLSKPARSR